MKFWINCVSKDHVVAGVQGEYIQAGQGKSNSLKRLGKGDLVVFYSAGTKFRAGERLQAFTAVGRLTDRSPYQVTVTPVFKPWRQRMAFIACDETSIVPLIPDLAFIIDKDNWGMPLRRGLFEITEADFGRIRHAMKAAISSSL